MSDQAFELRGPLTLGRHPNNAIQLLDRQCSKEHCRIEPRGESFVVVDLGSMNGTYVNGRRITEALLFDQDELVFGQTRARFENPGGPKRPFAVADLAQPVANRPSYEFRPAIPPPSARPADPPTGFVPFELLTRAGTNDPQLRADYERLRLFYELSRCIAEVRSSAELLAIVGNRLGLGVTLRRTALFLADPDGDLMHYGQWIRTGTPALPEVSPNLLEHVATEQSALLTHTAGANEKHSAVALPLFLLGEVSGVLWLDAAGFWNVRPRDLDLLVAIAQQISLVVETLRLNEHLEPPPRLH